MSTQGKGTSHEHLSPSEKRDEELTLIELFGPGADADTSLRPRPGETAEQTLDRVTAAVRES